jgi:hypothetical protein
MRTSTGRMLLLALSLCLAATPVAVGAQAAEARAEDQVTTRSLVIDPGLPPHRAATLRSTTPEVAPFPLDQTFLLHSKSGSSHTIYIDFDGALVSGTVWNEESNLVAKVHDGWTLDGDLTTFDEIERTAIQSIWQRVSEDYAPFDVDVTTADPGDAALDRSGPGDAVFGTRALVSRSTQAFQSICNNSCGGTRWDTTSGSSTTATRSRRTNRGTTPGRRSWATRTSGRSASSATGTTSTPTTSRTTSR